MALRLCAVPEVLSDESTHQRTAADPPGAAGGSDRAATEHRAGGRAAATDDAAHDAKGCAGSADPGREGLRVGRGFASRGTAAKAAAVALAGAGAATDGGSPHAAPGPPTPQT